MANEKLKFTCDYMEGAHPLIMDALLSTNMMQTSGYGLDEFSASARDKMSTFSSAVPRQMPR